MPSKYTIKDLERLSGIKAHTLRIWEQRYNILKPDRTDTNIRLYSNQDLRKILNISMINNINSNFSSTNWKDSNKARTLLNQAIQSINNGNVSNLRPILIQILDVMDRDDAEKLTGKLTR